MRPAVAYRLAGGLALFIALADQGSKWLVIQRFALGDRQPVVPGFFDLVYWRNTGAAWGMFSHNTLALGVLSTVVLALIAWRFRQLTDGRLERVVGLALVLGGIAGNLVDRFSRGAVVDFLLFYFHRFQWPAFNVADSGITVGVFLYVVSVLMEGSGQHQTAAATVPRAPAP
ncbi:MAG: signal peptidase II [Lentisphaeria bacterium]